SCKNYDKYLNRISHGSQFNKADVTLHQLIKAGRVGIFYKAKTTHSTIKGHDHFVCKISRSTNHKQIEKEISIMQKLGKHRNLLQLVDWDIMNSTTFLLTFNLT
ncbi:hypothetical protein P4O66_005736, partial [Electrophorus voltai]